jgi:hypothetical protein
MSKRKLQRTIKKAALSVPPSPERTITKEERDDLIERQRAGQRAMVIYDKWYKDFVGTPKRREDILPAFNKLIAQVDNEVKHQGTKDALMWMLEQTLADLYAAEKIGAFTMRVHAICPNQSMIGTEISICNWAGDLLVPQNEWMDAKAVIDCPQCGKPIEQKSMAEVKFTERPPEEGN